MKFLSLKHVSMMILFTSFCHVSGSEYDAKGGDGKGRRATGGDAFGNRAGGGNATGSSATGGDAIGNEIARGGNALANGGAAKGGNAYVGSLDDVEKAMKLLKEKK